MLSPASSILCPKCYAKMKPVFFRWKVGDIPCLSIYFYNAEIRTLLYRFKGCGDYELKDVFFAYLSFWFPLRFHGYTLVPAPSSKSHDEARGFNQVQAMCQGLGLPIAHYLEKRVEAKQSDLSAQQRKEVWKYMAYVGPSSLRGKKIMLVDDVYTTGSTAKACLSLLKARGPKKLVFLAMSKTLRK